MNNFSRIELKKASVKVPELESGKKRSVWQKRGSNAPALRMPVLSIAEILIKSAVEKAKTGINGKAKFEESAIYRVLKEEMPLATGGYGAVSKGYTAAPGASYVDYEKLFSHLGKFRAQSAYENIENSNPAAANSLTDNGFRLIDSEIMEKGAKYVKFFMPANSEIGSVSAVPVAGMNSSEWEQFKLWMKLDPVMYGLKTRLA